MGDVEFVVRLAVDAKTLDVTTAVACALGADNDFAAIGQSDAEAGQIGRAQYVLVAARTNRVETHGREDVPSRHLPAVVIAAQSAYVAAIHAVHDGAYPKLRFPRLGSPCIKIGNVVTRLVAVHIAAHKAVGRDVFIVLVILFRQVHAEQFVKALAEHFFSAHLLHHAINIVRHVKREVPGVSLDKAFVVSLIRVHAFLKPSVGIARAGKTRLGMIDIAIGKRPLGKLFGGRRLSRCLRGGIDGPIVVGILQSVGSRRGIAVVWHIAKLLVCFDAGHPLAVGGGCHGFERGAAVDVGAFGQRVCQNAHGMIARHAPAFIAHQTPNGQQAMHALLLMCQHGAHHVGVLLGLQ